mgnify:CR=1 FL=1
MIQIDLVNDDTKLGAIKAAINHQLWAKKGGMRF